MGEVALVSWMMVFVAAGTGASLLLAGIIIGAYGLTHGSQKIVWLGAFIASVAALLLSWPTWVWLDTFHPAMRAGASIQIVWGIGWALIVCSFAAFVRCAWKERRWD